MEQSELSLLACWWRKRKIGALADFSTSQIMEYLKAAATTKVAYKLEIRIAKNYLLKTLP